MRDPKYRYQGGYYALHKPTVSADTVYAFMSKDGTTVTAFSKRDGRLRWERKLSAFYRGDKGDAVVHGSTLYIRGNENGPFTAIDVKGGHVLWEVTAYYRFRRCVLARETIYARTTDGRLQRHRLETVEVPEIPVEPRTLVTRPVVTKPPKISWEPEASYTEACIAK